MRELFSKHEISDLIKTSFFILEYSYIKCRKSALCVLSFMSMKLNEQECEKK